MWNLSKGVSRMAIGRVDGSAVQHSVRNADTEKNAREQRVREEQEQAREPEAQKRTEEAARRGEVDLSA